MRATNSLKVRNIVFGKKGVDLSFCFILSCFFSVLMFFVEAAAATTANNSNLQSVSDFWLFVVYCLVVIVVVIFFLFYFNRVLGQVLTFIINQYTWRRYHAYIEVGKVRGTCGCRHH